MRSSVETMPDCYPCFFVGGPKDGKVGFVYWRHGHITVPSYTAPLALLKAPSKVEGLCPPKVELVCYVRVRIVHNGAILNLMVEQSMEESVKEDLNSPLMVETLDQIQEMLNAKSQA